MKCEYEHHKDFGKELGNCKIHEDIELKCGPFVCGVCRECNSFEFQKCRVCGTVRWQCCC